MLAQPRRITVGDVTFLVRTPWGLMRRFTQQLAEIEAAALGDRAAEAAVEAAMRDLLAEVVVGWEGAADEEGRAVPWEPGRLDDLDAAVVAELVRRLGEPGSELGLPKGMSG
jgi:hypothetical protein